MGRSSATAAETSVTEKRGPFTQKDDAVSAEILYLRQRLLETSEVRGRLDELHSLRAEGPAIFWPAFYRAVDDFGRTWSEGELYSMVTGPQPPGGAWIASMGLTGGRAVARRGRPSGKAPTTIDIVVRSITLKAGGARTWAEADAEAVVDEPRTPPDRAKIYRKQLRDRGSTRRGSRR